MKLINSVSNRIARLRFGKRVARMIIALWCLLLAFSVFHSTASLHSPFVSADSLSTQLGTNVTTRSVRPDISDRASLSDNRGTRTDSGPINTCVPAANDMPTPLSLTGMPTTLKKQIDAPNVYQIYGSDGSAIRSQIRKCGPVASGQIEAEFAAVTRYQLTWLYQFSSDNDVCEITRASVGMHINQTMPAWQSTSGALPGFADKWNVFDAALATHENGHAALDTKYAQQLLDDLNQFPPTACSQLAQSVKQLTDNSVSELEQAHDNYDSSTSHGATQGAILP